MTSGREAGVSVILVRPWTDGRAGGGCCGGEVRDGVGLDRLLTAGSRDRADDHDDPVARAWKALRECLPEVDVQIVQADNAWLPVAAFSAVRRRAGMRAGLGAAIRASRAGAVIVDGCRVGDVADLGETGVVAVVAARVDERE